MPAPTHMNLSDRKAFAVLSAYIRSVEREHQVSEGDLKRLYGNVVSAAEEAQDSETPELDRFVRDAAERSSQAALTMAGDPPPELLVAIVARFREEAAGIHCAGCAAGNVCSGGRTDDAVVSAPDGGQCLREIKDAFETALALTGKVYSQTLGLPLPPVDVALSTVGLTDRPGMVPGNPLAANAETRYEDMGRDKRSLVRVAVASLHLDRRTLAAFPYILLHEAFCHAFQMARHDGSRPRKGEIDDPVSEGMMDALAAGMLQAVADESGAAPAHAAADEAREIHLARASLTRHPRFPEAPAVARGVEVLRMLRACFAGEGLDADTLVLRLACDLNLQSWSFAERRQGLSRLASRLNGPHRDPSLLDLLFSYASGGDVGPLIDYLTTS